MGACQSNAGASVSDNVVKIRSIPSDTKNRNEKAGNAYKESNN